MVSLKDEFLKFMYNIFDIISIDRELGTILFIFLMGLFTVKDIKRWNEISKFDKNMDIAIWAAIGMLVIFLIVALIRGDL